MDIREDLNERIKVQSAIIHDCYKIYEDITFLSITDHSKEIAEIIAGDRFFIRAGNYMWAIIVLELNKLYDKRENYSLTKTLNFMIDNYESLNFAQSNDLALVQLQEEIEAEETKSIVKKLNHIRDKQVAHLDRNRMNKEILIYKAEAKYLVDLGHKVLSQVSSQLNGYALGLNFDFLGRCETTIIKLARYRSMQM